MPDDKEVRLDATKAEMGRRRLIRYIDEGRASTVPGYLRNELANYRPSSDPRKDSALETFERACAFCGLPTPEELDDEIRKNDHEPPIYKLDSRLVRIHVQPVIGAFTKNG